MKISKIILVLLSLLSLNSLHAFKIYTTTGGEKLEQPNVFDVGIFLEEVDRDGLSDEEKSLIEESELRAMTAKLRYLIEDEEAAIVSAPLMRNFLRLSGISVGNKYEKFHTNYELFRNTRKQLYTENWHIFLTRDNEFVTLIPTSKYTEIKKTRRSQKNRVKSKRIF